MTSKLRFLCDGTGDVYVKCYFSQLSSTSSTLLGPWKPYPGSIDHALRSLLDTSQQNEHRPATTVQLLAKKRSIFLAIFSKCAANADDTVTKHTETVTAHRVTTFFMVPIEVTFRLRSRYIFIFRRGIAPPLAPFLAIYRGIVQSELEKEGFKLGIIEALENFSRKKYSYTD